MLIPVTDAAPVVALPEAKAHLRVDFTDDDAYITSLIVAATTAVGDRTGRTLGLQEFDYRVDSLRLTPAWCGAIWFPAPPLVSVASVKYVDADGVEQTLEPTKYRVFGVGTSRGGGIRLAEGSSWPAVRPGLEAMTIRFTAGYEAPPEPIRHAILMIVGHLYAHRGEMVKSDLMEDPAIKSLLAPYRVLGV